MCPDSCRPAVESVVVSCQSAGSVPVHTLALSVVGVPPLTLRAVRMIEPAV